MPLIARITFAASAFALLASVPSGAAEAADGRACHLTGVFNFHGVSEVMDDCMENTGLSDEQFQRACDSHFSGAKDLARQVGGAVTNDKLAWLPSCPASAQATCSGFGGAAITVHYYSRPAEQLARLPEGCAALGGRYSPN